MREFRLMALVAIGMFAVGCGGGDGEADSPTIDGPDVVRISVPGMM